MAKLVKFDNGTFGIKRGFWVFAEFLGKRSSPTDVVHWWSMVEHIKKFAQFSTATEAIGAYRLATNKPFIEYEEIKSI
jgi:hypothetical protein